MILPRGRDQAAGSPGAGRFCWRIRPGRGRTTPPDQKIRARCLAGGGPAARSDSYGPAAGPILAECLSQVLADLGAQDRPGNSAQRAGANALAAKRGSGATCFLPDLAYLLTKGCPDPAKSPRSAPGRPEGGGNGRKNRQINRMRRNSESVWANLPPSRPAPNILRARKESQHHALAPARLDWQT